MKSLAAMLTLSGTLATAAVLGSVSIHGYGSKSQSPPALSSASSPADTAATATTAATIVSTPSLVTSFSSSGVNTPAAAPTNAPPIHCDYAYCSSGTSYCFYFGGITAWDMSKGPVPGETMTTMGSCTITPATTSPGAVSTLVMGKRGNKLTPPPEGFTTSTMALPRGE